MFKSHINFNDKLCKGRIAYENLAKLQNQIVQVDTDTVSLDITTKGWFGRTFSFLISCLLYHADANEKEVKKITLPTDVYERLVKLSFIESPQITLGKGIDLRRIHLDSNANTLNLAIQIVKDMPVDMSTRLHEDMVSRIGEVFNNAREHSMAKHVLAGRYPKPGRKYCFVCYDTGIGIPEKVRHFKQCGKDELTDEQALRWALQQFNSTSDTGNPRGQGFDLLRSFTRLNSGVIRICTGNTLYTYDCRAKLEKVNFQMLSHSFCGTLFEMDVNTDNRKYLYKGETR